MVYTTEPWTLTGISAIVVHPNMNYIVFQHNNGKDDAFYIIAHSKWDDYKEQLKRNYCHEISASIGEGLHELKVTDPIFGKTLRVCIDENINFSYGSGINIVCPGHFMNDVIIAQVIINLKMIDLKYCKLEI